MLRSSGWAEADPEAWWRSVVRVLGELALTTKLEDVACDRGGRAGADGGAGRCGGRRGAPGDPVARHARGRRSEASSAPQAYYLGPKLLWLARHEPTALARTKWMLQSHAFVAQRLTGEVAVDPSTAALALPLFDLGEARMGA